MVGVKGAEENRKYTVERDPCVDTASIGGRRTHKLTRRSGIRAEREAEASDDVRLLEYLYTQLSVCAAEL